MNTGICEKCGTTIPLRASDGQPHSSHTCKICDPPKQAHGRKGFFGILFHVLALAATAFLGFTMQKCSFNKVAEIRQLARVPQTDVQAVVPGETNLQGAAFPVGKKDGNLLVSPDKKKKCLYYRYLVEREERDSDGDTRWVTEIDEKKFVPRFLLRDKTGEIVVRPNGRVDFNVPESNQRRSGKRRYTEYRLDPGDATFVFGYVESLPESDGSEAGYLVAFDKVGDYQPLISEKSELKERTGRATSSIFLCWFGLVLIGVTTVVLFSLTGQHRLLIYFWVLSMAIGAVLVSLGIAMMRTDLRSAHEHVVRQNETVTKVIADALEKENIPWDRKWASLEEITPELGLDERQTERLRRVRIDLAAASRRVTAQAKKFPYSLIAGSLDLSPLPEIPLPPADETMLTELESNFQKARLTGFSTWIWGLVGMVVAFLATWLGFRSVRLKRMTEALATSPTAGVVYGLAELKGVIDLPEGIDPLRGPVSSKPCVTFDYQIHEKRRSGKNTKWVQIHHEEERCDFLCRDREGTFPIDPDGAELIGWRRDVRQEGKHRHTESRLQFGDPLYAIGMAEIDPDTGDSLYLCRPETKDEPFVLSSFTEKAVVAKRGIRAIMWLTGAFGAVLLAGLMLFASRGAFSPADYLAAALVGPAYLFVLTLILHYNDLVFLRQRARRNWSAIEVSLKKRYDLMPPMIEIAKAYMAHEQGLQSRLAVLRGGYGGGVALNPDAATQLLEEGHALSGIFMGHIEANPDLKAATGTALVMRQIIALEDEIAFMRAGYNDAVQQYNTRIATFPDVLFAKIGNFRPMDLLTYDARVIPMPEITGETWRRQQVAEESAAEATAAVQDRWTVVELPVPDPEAPVIDAFEERAFLHACLLDELGEERERQLGMIVSFDGQVMADAVAMQVTDAHAINSWNRLARARTLMPKLRFLSADNYHHFKGVARSLIESDDRLSTYEYAFQKALAYLVDPVFTPFDPPEIRHTSEESLGEAIEALRSHLSNPSDEDNLGAFDAAMNEVFHATAEVRSHIYRQCHEAFIQAGGEPNSERFLLVQSLADGLFLSPME